MVSLNGEAHFLVGISFVNFAKVSLVAKGLDGVAAHFVAQIEGGNELLRRRELVSFL